MGRAGRRNTRQKAAYFIKAFASYHGNLCVHLQDADTSERLEHALENLKTDQRIDESFLVGSHVIVTIEKFGTRKFRRAAIDTIGTDSVNATDLDTNEYYPDVERGNVYNIAHLGDEELIEAQGAQPYYVHGFHTSECVVDPQNFAAALKAVEGVRWTFAKTREEHLMDKGVPVIKLFKANKSRTEEKFPDIQALPRGVSVMPPLFCGSIEEVRVYRSAETMGVQLCYLPLHELRRLETYLTEALESGAWKTCDAASTQEHQLVIASYEGRRVRGFVAEVKKIGACVYLMDYGIYEKFRFSALRSLCEEFAFKLPRYGLQVRLREEPKSFLDDRIVKVELETRIDEFTWEGSIIGLGDIPEGTSQCKKTEVEAGVAAPTQDEADRDQSVSDDVVEDLEDTDLSMSLSSDDCLSPTEEEFSGSNNETVSPAALPEEAMFREETDCATPSSPAPAEPDSFGVFVGEADSIHPVSHEQIVPNDVAAAVIETERSASPKLIPQVCVPLADDESLPLKGEVEPSAIRSENAHEVVESHDPTILSGCPDSVFRSEISDDSATTTSSNVSCSLIPEPEASKDLAALGESSLDAGFIHSPRKDAGESEADHLGTEVEDVFPSDEPVIVRIPPDEPENSVVPCLSIGTALWRRILRILTQIFWRKWTGFR